MQKNSTGLDEVPPSVFQQQCHISNDLEEYEFNQLQNKLRRLVIDISMDNFHR